MRRLLIVHLAGNAVLLALGYYWLGVGESDGARLSLSLALIAVIATGLAWIHGSALAYFRANGSWRAGHLAPLIVFVFAAAALYLAAEYWNPVSESRINQTSSYLTLTFQTPVRPASVARVFRVIWWIVEWVMMPLLLLPMASGIAARGWAGFTEIGAKLRSWSYWLAVPVLLFFAVKAPLLLLAWKPGMATFALETASFIARFGLAYLLFVMGCLALAFVTSRGKPEETQLSTAASP